MSQPRVLLNAEPFGFGPAAAMADFFPLLRNMFTHLGYVGERHTLDLHRHLGYDEVHDLTGMTIGEQEDRLNKLFCHFDVFFTALDCSMAQKALDAGLRVYIYDPLTWYWKSIHPVIAKCDLYLAQDFYGVKERIASEPQSFRSPKVVPPAIPGLHAPVERKHVLLNLGGLNNPLWSNEDTVAYARVVVAASFEAMSSGNELVVIAANAAIATDLKRFGVKNYPRSHMQTLLAQSKYALMTPGLGNIYDAARFSTPTVWLPPANDSQGQQLRVLIDHGIVDGAIDWPDFAPNFAIDYHIEQGCVLKRISEAVQHTAQDLHTQNAFRRCMEAKIREIRTVRKGRCHSLVETFGSGGLARAAELIKKQVKKEFG